MRAAIFPILALVAGLNPAAASSASPQQSTPTRDLLLQSQTYAVGDESIASFAFDLTIDIPDLDLPPPREPTVDAAVFEIHVSTFDQVHSRSEVEAALVGGFGTATDTFALPLAGAVVDGPDGSIGLQFDVPIEGVNPTPDRLDLIEPGIYPTTISLLRDGVVFAQHITFLERVRDSPVGLGPFTLAVLAVVDDPGPAADNAEILALRPQLNEIASIADTIAEPITVQIPPAVVDRVVNTDPELHDRLTTALVGDTLIDGPAVTIDVDAAAAAKIDAKYAELRVDGAEILKATFPDSTVVDDMVLIDHPLTYIGAQLLDRLGVRYAVIDDPTLTNNTSNTIDIAKIDPSLLVSGGDTDGHELSIAVVDPAMEFLDPNRTTNNTAAADAINLMAIISSQRQGTAPALRSLVLATPTFGVPDADVLEHLERYVAEHPDFRLAPLADLPAATNTNFIDGEPLTINWPTFIDGRLLVRELATEDARQEIATASSMLSDLDERQTEWASQLDRALSTTLSDVQAMTILGEVRSAADAVQTAIPPPEPFAFTITGSDTPLRVRLMNNDVRSLNVVVGLESDRLQADDTPIRLAPGEVTNVDIDLRVRSNGRTPVLLTVSAPNGEPLFEPVELNARVNTLSGLGRVVSVGGLLVLLSWWLTYLRRRRRHATSATEEPAQTQ